MHQTMHYNIHKINPHTKYGITHCLLQGTYNNQYQILRTTSKKKPYNLR